MHRLSDTERARLLSYYDDDEVELGEIVAQYLDEAYERFFGTAMDHEFERRVSWTGWLNADPVLLVEPRRGIPRQDVDVSPEAMERVRASLDGVRECYGTSGELDPRGYWMRLDVESDQGLAGETRT